MSLAGLVSRVTQLKAQGPSLGPVTRVKKKLPKPSTKSYFQRWVSSLASGAIGALMSRVQQPRTLLVLDPRFENFAPVTCSRLLLLYSGLDSTPRHSQVNALAGFSDSENPENASLSTLVRRPTLRRLCTCHVCSSSSSSFPNPKTLNPEP